VSRASGTICSARVDGKQRAGEARAEAKRLRIELADYKRACGIHISTILMLTEDRARLRAALEAVLECESARDMYATARDALL
jgi:hypothetical protein